MYAVIAIHFGGIYAKIKMCHQKNGEVGMDERYHAHAGLSIMGETGQQRLAGKRVLCIGAGGLGSVALFILAGSGIGTIGVLDGDRVSLGNLNRQFLYRMEDIGAPKAGTAIQALKRLNPSLAYTAFNTMLDGDNALPIIQEYDLVMSAVDNLHTRLIINQACGAADVPLVNGGVNGLKGMVQLVRYGISGCLSCMYGDAPQVLEAPVSFPPVVSVISSMMAQCAIAYLLTGEDPLDGCIAYYDGASLSLRHIPTKPAAGCPVCAGHQQKPHLAP